MTAAQLQHEIVPRPTLLQVGQQRALVVMAMDRVGAQSAFIRARKAEDLYARQLRKIAGMVGDLIRGMWHPEDPAASDAISAVLGRYAKTLEPWAEAVGRRMITEVAAALPCLDGHGPHDGAPRSRGRLSRRRWGRSTASG